MFAAVSVLLLAIGGVEANFCCNPYGKKSACFTGDAAPLCGQVKGGAKKSRCYLKSRDCDGTGAFECQSGYECVSYAEDSGEYTKGFCMPAKKGGKKYSKKMWKGEKRDWMVLTPGSKAACEATPCCDPIMAGWNSPACKQGLPVCGGATPCYDSSFCGNTALPCPGDDEVCVQKDFSRDGYCTSVKDFKGKMVPVGERSPYCNKCCSAAKRDLGWEDYRCAGGYPACKSAPCLDSSSCDNTALACKYGQVCVQKSAGVDAYCTNEGSNLYKTGSVVKPGDSSPFCTEGECCDAETYGYGSKKCNGDLPACPGKPCYNSMDCDSGALACSAGELCYYYGKDGYCMPQGTTIMDAKVLAPGELPAKCAYVKDDECCDTSEEGLDVCIGEQTGADDDILVCSSKDKSDTGLCFEGTCEYGALKCAGGADCYQEVSSGGKVPNGYCLTKKPSYKFEKIGFNETSSQCPTCCDTEEMCSMSSLPPCDKKMEMKLL